jgi:hypothetical protein
MKSSGCIGALLIVFFRTVSRKINKSNVSFLTFCPQKEVVAESERKKRVLIFLFDQTQFSAKCKGNRQFVTTCVSQCLGLKTTSNQCEYNPKTGEISENDACSPCKNYYDTPAATVSIIFLSKILEN